MTTEIILTTLLNDVIAACTKAKTALAPPIGPIYPLTDRLSRPKPPLPMLGPAGFTFTDPIFRSRMLRVTDEKTTGGSTSWRTSSASDRVWNADGTVFFVENSGAGTVLFDFDPVTMKATPRTTDVPLVAPTWHQTNTHLLYGRDRGERPAVASFDVETRELRIFYDVLLGIPAIATRGRTYLRGVAQAGGAVAFICGGTGQDSDDFVVWMSGVGPEKILNTRDRLGIFCHAVALDASGRYVVIGSTSADINAGKAPNYVWDTTTNTLMPITSSPGGHGAIGYGVSINAANERDSQEYRYRTFTAPNTTRLIITDLPTPAQSSASSHLSWNHVKADNLQPFVVASFRFGPGYAVTDLQPWRPWDDEIVSVAMDGKTITRHGHHRSDVRPDGLPVGDPHVGYWATPRPRTSPDGRFAIFTSNWEKTLGADPAGAGDLSPWRQDVFLIELKP